jgi:23S rRNA pseudouridine1911/1915/1917 synthase
LKAGDVVRILPTGQARPADSSAIKVVYQDEHVVIFDKPAGVTSVRHFEERTMHVKRRQLQPTLEELAPEAIARHLYEERHAKDDSDLRRRKARSSREIEELIKSTARRHHVIAVHRLDRDTSGLIMFARTKPAAVKLGAMFRKHEIDRRYTAVVQGDCKAQTLVSYMVRDRGDGRRGSIAIVDGLVPEDAVRAITHVRQRELIQLADRTYSIVECKLETGKTHQIRIHLAEAGHPICGEPIYNRTSSGKVIEDTSKAPRQALHAGAIKFIHPLTGELVSLIAKIPPDLTTWLQSLQTG